MGSNKFDALAAEVDVPFKVILIDALTSEAIVDKQGNNAFIEVLSVDSTEGQLFDKESRRVTNTRLMAGRKEAVANEDTVETNKRKTARLTKSWHLVDPATGEVIDVPCNQANALELYMSNRTHHIWQQVWMGAIEPGKFYQALADDICGYGEHEWRHNRKVKGGGSEGEHAEVADEIFANLGITRAASVEAYVVGPELREEGEYLWTWFCQISMGLSSSGFGVPAVGWEDIRCWRELMRVTIDPWEVALMVRLGQLRASILSEPDKKT